MGGDVAGEPGQPKAPRWARYQIATALVCGVLGVGLFILQGVDRLVVGVDLDFGPLPYGLSFIGMYVIFGEVVARLVQGLGGKGNGG